MKKLFVISFLLISVFAKSQTIAGFCVQVSCPIQIQLPINSAQLVGAATVNGDTITSYKWAVTGPGGTLATPTAASTAVTGLTTPGTYTFSLTVATKHGSVMTNPGAIVTVLAAPVVVAPAAPVITGITVSLWGQTFSIPPGQGTKIVVSYNGTTQTLTF